MSFNRPWHGAPQYGPQGADIIFRKPGKKFEQPGRQYQPILFNIENRERFDRVLVTAYDPAYPVKERFLPDGVIADERFVWIFDHDEMVEEVAEHVPRLPEE